MSKVITPLCRTTYAFVWELKQQQNGDMKFACTFMFPKDTTNVASLKKGIGDAMRDKFGDDSKKWPGGWWNPLRDGDVARSDSPDFAKMWFITAKSDTKPGIVYKNGQEIIEKEDLYSGCWVIASINFYGFDTAGNKGVGVGLNHIMKKKDDERLDGRRTAEQDFADYIDEDSDDDGTGFGTEVVGEPEDEFDDDIPF